MIRQREIEYEKSRNHIYERLLSRPLLVENYDHQAQFPSDYNDYLTGVEAQRRAERGPGNGGFDDLGQDALDQLNNENFGENSDNNL